MLNYHGSFSKKKKNYHANNHTFFPKRNGGTQLNICLSNGSLRKNRGVSMYVL